MNTQIHLLISLLLSTTLLAQNGFQALPLGASLSDISGMTLSKDVVYAINDAGDAPVIYALNPENFAIQKKITVKNAMNYDWEELTQDEYYLYIGDFGNNSGNRQNLCIYKIPKNQLHQKQVEAEIIRFKYENQTEETYRYERHNFDAEAMVVYQGKIFIFTKNWENQATDVYTMSVEQGFHWAEKIAKYSIEGYITAAYLAHSKNQVSLLGHSQNGESFIVQISSFYQEGYCNAIFTKEKIQPSDIQPEKLQAMTVDFQQNWLFALQKNGLEENAHPHILKWNSPQNWSHTLNSL